MSDIELDYDFLTQRALRRVVIDVLEMTTELGATPGDHHFYIEFLTDAPGVSIPDELREHYPDRMTIVLQHQFEELTVSERDFAVTLWFKGKQSRLKVPFDAVTSFADPSVQFGLRFSDVAGLAGHAPADNAAPVEAGNAPSKTADEENSEEPKDGADVVNLDAFRKK